MDFLHKKFFLKDTQTVEVMCSHQCNLLLLDDINFQYYKNGRKFSCYGGFYKQFPARLTPPFDGEWNVVLDIAGWSGTIEYSINVLN